MAFQPRLELVGRVWAAFGDGPAVLAQVVTAGDGGVGKTQLAAAVFEQARDTGTELLMWVNATSRNSVLSTYARACAAVSAPIGVSVDQAAEGFLEWLENTTRRWLIVLDDIADPADLRDLWPNDTRGRVLITTRHRHLGRGVEVPVGVFAPDESLAFLTEKLAIATDAPEDLFDEAAELAEDLGHLPVALAQAGAVIATDATTCADYRRRFADRTNELDSLFPGHARADDYRRTVATAWALAIDQANALEPAGLASPALEIAAVVDPNGAPESLWATTAALDHTRNRCVDRNEAVTPESLRAALRNLHRLSLVTHDPNGSPQAVRAHALVQRAVLDALSADQLDTTISAAADALEEIWPDPENDPVLSQTLRNNADTLTHHPTNALWIPDAHPVLFSAGNSLGETGQVAQAITYHQHLHTTAQQLLGPDHPDTLTTRHELARWRGAAGDPTGAATALEQVLTDELRVLGPDHPSTLTTRHELAYWRGAAGDPTGAATALEQVLTDELRVLGPDHPDTLITLANLAYGQGEAGDPTGAATAFEELLTDRIRVLGPDHPDTLTTRSNLAHWRGAAGDPTGAATALEQLLPDRVRVLGPDHPNTLNTRHQLAYWRARSGGQKPTPG